MSNGIICPYCESKTFDDDGVYANLLDQKTDCPDCGKDFLVSGYVEITYTTRKLPCAGGHRWGRTMMADVTQETCERWRREKFLPYIDHKPHRNWMRECLDCEAPDVQEVEPGGACPWPLDGEPDKEIPY